jgi:hypothetical protein
MYMKQEDGFTILELTIAMAIFSFMLTIIITGVVMVVGMHNQALEDNIVQTNAQTVMADLERIVRDSSSVTEPSVLNQTPGYLCLDNGSVKYYVLKSQLLRATAVNCVVSTPPVAMTPSDVNVAYFNPVLQSVGVHPSIRLELLISTPAPTFIGAGSATSCLPTQPGKTVCSVTRLISIASPRRN